MVTFKKKNVSEENFQDLLTPSKEQFEATEDSNTRTVNLNNFDQLKTVGVGTFSRVMLVQPRDEKRFYAMKVLNKQKLVRLKSVPQAANEKRILQGPIL